MRHFRGRPRVDRKPDRTYVTQADTAIELELRERIEKRYPAHGVLAEEYGDRTSNQETRWIIDPIDATHSYLRGVPAFATLIALERAGELEVGVMSAPAKLCSNRSSIPGTLPRHSSSSRRPADG
jgi:histidinol-phosphatase